jgi:alkanesulfonate monooxygenase SsuD/methylene tetrahydromethanopterin reductase-like flavin-dependent oxidoreductase (luciferase family)
MTKMHLMWFCAFSPHAGFGLDGWSGPRTGSGYDWTKPELWQDMAVALERAKFDLIMLGDSLAVPGTYQGRMDAYLRYAEHAPFHDPSPLVAIMAAATHRIGLAATLSTTFYPPFLLARLMTTLDHLSRGRIAWNVVTSYKREEALNFGYQELLDHDQRYDRADEYMELCYQLWTSWEPEAVVMDPRTDTFADVAKVRTIDFEGTYYRSRGPLNATPSPQGRPVIIQAGTSERGQDFAAFKARVCKHGRQPEDCKIFFLAKPIIGDTDEVAQQRADALYANAPVEAGLAALSTLLQIDLSTYALDQPLPASIQARAIQGIRSQLDRFYLSGRSPTLREIATRKVSLDSMPFIGTPQRVADSLACTIEAVGGDGFAIRQGLWPGYVSPFVEQVVPLLQQRGAARAEYAGTTLREHLQEF